jgi:Tol biopolymer transport system component
MMNVEVTEELDRILASPGFTDADRLQRFLRFVVEETLAGRGGALKESVIGVEVFGRAADYDPKVDPVVRVQARRLRVKLDEYYAAAGAGSIRIGLPKGGYAAEFVPVAAEVVVPETRVAPAPLVAPAKAPRRRFVVAGAAIVVVCAAAAMLAMRGGRTDSHAARLFTAYPGYQNTPAFSPDGMTIAFAWGGEGGDNVDIYVQRLDADSPRRITTSPAAERRPVWLADGQQLAFLRDAGPGRFSVVVVPVLGGGERTLAEIQASPDEPPAMSWSRDGKRLYTSERAASSGPLRVVEIQLETGARRVLTNPPASSTGDDEAALSPDEKWIAYRRVSESAIHDVFVQPAGGGTARPITHDRAGMGGLAWTRDSKALIISTHHEGGMRSLWRFAIDGGEPARLTDPTEAAAYPAVSPRDGTVAYASRFLDTNIYRVDLEGQTPSKRIIASNLLDSCPHYSPDGRRIAFRSSRTGTDELWVTDADGGSPARLTDFGGPTTGSGRWSPDGQFLVLDSRQYGNADLYVVPSGGGGVRRLTQEKSNEVLPSYSADGKWIYFASDRSASWQVWKMPAIGGPALQVTEHGGFAPLASPDGRWLYYAKRDQAGLFRMPVAGGAEETVLDSLPPPMWGAWGLTGDSVVYLSFTGERESPARVEVLAAGKSRVAGVLRLRPVTWDGALGVSPDGKWALVAEVERAGSEIHLRAP